MKPTSRMWISAGVVGLILAGGASIAVAASAGRIDRAEMERAHIDGAGEARQEGLPFSSSSATPTPGPSAGSEDDDIVVTRRLNEDPESVLDYWTEERMRDARPQRMPVVVVSPTR